MPVEQINNTSGTVTHRHHDQQGGTRLLTGSVLYPAELSTSYLRDCGAAGCSRAAAASGILVRVALAAARALGAQSLASTVSPPIATL
jgi:hypothetical protein